MTAKNDPLSISIEVAVKLLLILFIVAWCFQLVAPFISFVLWGAVIAVSLYSPFCTLRTRIGNKLAVTVFTVSGLALVLIPAWLFADSLINSIESFSQAVTSGEFVIPPPNESVQSWWLIGDKLYTAWAQAAADFEVFLESYHEQLKSLASVAATKVAGLGMTVMMFILATAIAAAMLANEASISKGMNRLFVRLMGKDKAAGSLSTVTATIRSVTVGVLGIAFIQAVLAGIGMIAVGVPAAGILALIVLILAIAQIPVLLVMIPVIIYVFSVQSTTIAVVFAIWGIVVATGDAALKPMFLGRGVDVPTLVILLGAIGGMITTGIIGLFVGAVVLALGYELFVAWIKMDDEPAETS